MKRRSLVFIAILFILLSGCNNDAEANESDEHAGKSFNRESVESHIYYPLTGLQANLEPTNRIVSVMVNNHPAARPQTGLSKADIVFEILAEGQTTRFLAMFHSEVPEVVGPVRSARPYYFNLANDYNALYVYHGAANFIEDMLRAGAADHLNGAYYDNDGNLFKRESFRVAPHNSYLQFNAVADVAINQGYQMEASYQSLDFLTAEEISELQGEAATDISLMYGQESVRYLYDEPAEKYLRFSAGQQTIELTDETPIQLDNVFIIETTHQVVDQEGRREVDLQSGGNALLLQKGQLQRIQWENQGGRLIPVREGEPVGLVPGQTWVNVIPTDPGLSGVTGLE
nr:DUF3048 domain-containing protein [Amphibacillus marinus]